MECEGGTSCQVRGESLGGGKIRISRVNGVGVDITGAYATLFVGHKDAPGLLASLTRLLADAEVNIAFCRTYRTEQGGRAYSVFETDGAPADGVLPQVRAPARRELRDVHLGARLRLRDGARRHRRGALRRRLPAAGRLLRARPLHRRRPWRCASAASTGAECAEASMRHVIEVHARGDERADRRARPNARRLHRRRGAARGRGRRALGLGPHGATQTGRRRARDGGARALGRDGRDRGGADGGLGGRGARLRARRGGRDGALARRTWRRRSTAPRRWDSTSRTHACVAGAEGGLPGRGGLRRGRWRPAALVELLGGTPEQALTARLPGNLQPVGPRVRPVGGLVEVPCQARNAIGVAAAFSAAQLALSGVRWLVPFDEVVRAMGRGRSRPALAPARDPRAGGLRPRPRPGRACAGLRRAARSGRAPDARPSRPAILLACQLAIGNGNQAQKRTNRKQCVRGPCPCRQRSRKMRSCPDGL